MTIKKLSVFSILLMITTAVALWIVYKKTTSPLPPTFTFEVIPQETINPDIQINIVFYDYPIDDQINYQKYTLLHEGMIYPLNRKQDYAFFQVFIRKGNQFAYINQENILFSPDKSHSRAKLNRHARLSFAPEVRDNQMKTVYQQYLDGVEVINSESTIELSSIYNYPILYPGKESTIARNLNASPEDETKLSDFTTHHFQP